MISVCIPCYEFHGKGAELLLNNLKIIEKQTYKDIQVVVSDNCQGYEISNVIHRLKWRLDIKYVRNEHEDKTSGYINFNNAIRNADGNLIHLMCQDDYFIDENAIRSIVDNFEDAMWSVCGLNIINEKQCKSLFHTPRWRDTIILGFNYIGPPSLLTMKKEAVCLFDPQIKYYGDCELYYQLYIKYGPPKIITENCVVYREWDLNNSKDSAQFSYIDEIEYIKKKYMLPFYAKGNIPV